MIAKSISATLTFILIPVLVSTYGVHQEESPSSGQTSSPLALEEVNSKAKTLWSQVDNSKSSLSYFTANSRRREEEKKIKEAARALRRAETSDEQDAARETLTELLDVDYDSRLAEYETYLDGLEQQLSAMRDKLAKRRKAKAKMIELRIQILEAEADDLGWPSRMSGRSGLSLFPARLPAAPEGSLSSRFELAPKPVQPAQPTQPASRAASGR